MNIITRINWVDVLVIIIILRTSYVAFSEGLSHELFPLVGSLVLAISSLHYYARLGTFIRTNLMNMPVAMSEFLSLLAIVVVVGLLFKLLKFLLDLIIKVEWNPLVEKFGGIVVGIFRAFVAASLVLMIMSLIPLSYLQRSIRDRSVTGTYVLGICPYIYEKACKVLPVLGRDSEMVNRDDILKKLKSDKSVPVDPKPQAQKSSEWEKVAKF